MSFFSPATITALIQSQTDNAAIGTGLIPLLKMTKEKYGTVPAYLEKAVQAILPATFGGYPTSADIAPSAVFLAVFIVLTAGHCYVFAKNWSRGHRFYVSLAVILYGFMNWIGYALRISWAQNMQRVHTGLASTVLLLCSTVLLAGTNLVLAQRIYTWRHPKIGSSKVFEYGMYFIYFLVLGTIIMGVVSGVVPYLYFLSEERFNMCKKVARAAGLLTVLYSFGAVGLLILAFVHPPKQKDPNFAVYQPWWIQSFGICYFVPKGSAKIARDTFVERPDHHKKAVRVIASTTQHYTTVEEIKTLEEEAAPSLHHNWSILIICLTTVLLLISSCFRCASLFIDKQVYEQTFIFKPVVLYCTHGLLEFLVLVLYLVTRIDLRFYKPDHLKMGATTVATTSDDTNNSNNSSYEKEVDAVSTNRPTEAAVSEAPAAAEEEVNKVGTPVEEKA
ncbi:hypothetical protein DASC09_007490 [Saccharomycopsis crataegensis]|uniref:Uncharacterized protein n=1 Tax=Saccharomycopsis crataegensis TaxID=43959 RepID=A0AAV5QFI2_9ASCO|nr:hypothetical protein DASC09_007490 [Saccharomycopsis crataegensis]